MVASKSATLTLRIDPYVEEALCTAAAQEHCSITNIVEALIRVHRGRNDISIYSIEAVWKGSVIGSD